MSLKYTLLGFLNYGAMTGYDIKTHMDNSTQFFWHAKLSQIYPALKRMEEDAWVESTIMPQEGKPDKKYYEITDKGRAALMDWLDEFPSELVPHKQPELLKIFFAGAMEKELFATGMGDESIPFFAVVPFHLALVGTWTKGRWRWLLGFLCRWSRSGFTPWLRATFCTGRCMAGRA